MIFCLSYYIIYSLNLHVFAGAEENFDKNWVNRYLCLIESSKSMLCSVVVEEGNAWEQQGRGSEALSEIAYNP